MRLPSNAVLNRELTERMRTRRGPVLITMYLLSLIGILKLVADGTMGSTSTMQCVNNNCFPVQRSLATAAVGRPMFHWILFFVLLLVCFIAPGITASAIAGERARQTLVPLQVTLLRPFSIVIGKLLASLAFVALLLVATLPLLTLSFWLGGVSAFDVLKGLGMVFVVAIVLASLGIMCSAWVRFLRGAIVTAYGVVFALTLGTTALYVAQQIGPSTGQPRDRNPAVLILNPFVATADVVGGSVPMGPGGFSPFDGIASVFDDHRGSRFTARIGGSPSVTTTPARGGPVPFWLQSVLSYAAVCAGALWLAARKLRTPAGNP